MTKLDDKNPLIQVFVRSIQDLLGATDAEPGKIAFNRDQLVSRIRDEIADLDDDQQLEFAGAIHDLCAKSVWG